ncbi:MAG TPA: Ku protein [Candidatus Acidoferrales bacterium]|nr:Ku protein [Candidatus Acidoferrales bacterium]
MAASSWKGFLTFGLISIPIRLSPAARTERISFNQLHKECHTRLKQPLFCPTCNRVVERSEVEKGYEYEDGQYVLFTAEELDKVEPESARSMEILEFVKLDEIDPVFFDSSYYAAPEEGGAKAYSLLTEAMQQSGYAGIAKVTMHNRENIVIIRASDKGLTLHTMFYTNEIRSAETAGADKVEVKEQERTLATQLIENLAAKFEPDKYRDTYQESLRALVAAKTAGREVTATAHSTIAPVIDLMDALKKSLAKQSAAPERKQPLRIVSRTKEPVVKQRKKA